jgi:hypothetical protein
MRKKCRLNLLRGTEDILKYTETERYDGHTIFSHILIQSGEKEK